ncbi:Retrovirus-related Pol polyprotein from transposon 17.6, partial [Mucuna pruriens]
MVVYFDDILVYSTCVDDHVMHAKLVLELPKKRIIVIQSWPTLNSMSNVRSFHGLASFYRYFVKEFSILASHLNEIIKKNIGFKKEESQERTFQALKNALTHAHILALPNFAKSFELECDGSNVVVATMLLQEGHPIAYFSEKFKCVQLNYSTYDKELYPLVRALQV